MKSGRWFLAVSIPAIALILAAAPSARACAVCYGDPQSPLTHGAKQGILVMVIITYAVVIGLGTMFTFMIVRARKRGP